MYNTDKAATTDHGHAPRKTDNTTDLTIPMILENYFFKFVFNLKNL